MKNYIYTLLKKSEKIFKTDMIYLAKGSMWLSFNQVTAILFGFLLNIAFANLFPVVEYGIYRYLMSISVILGAFSLTGMNTAISRAVAMKQEGYIKKSFWVQLKWNILIIFPISFGIAGYYFFHANNELALGVTIIGLLTPFIYAANTFYAYLSGKANYKGLFFHNLLINGSNTLITFLAILFLKNALPIITLLFVTQILTYFWSYYKTVHTVVHAQPNTDENKKTEDLGKHLSIINFFSIVAQNLDKIVAFQFLGAAPLAIYYFAAAIPAQLGGIGKMITTLAFPKLSKKHSEQIPLDFKEKVIKLILLFTAFAIVYIIVAPYIYKIFFPQYISSILYSQLCAIIFIFTAPSLYVSSILQIRAQKKQLYSYTLVTSVIQSVLMISLGYTFGIFGLIASHIASSIINLTYSTYLATRPSADLPEVVS